MARQHSVHTGSGLGEWCTVYGLASLEKSCVGPIMQNPVKGSADISSVVVVKQWGGQLTTLGHVGSEAYSSDVTEVIWNQLVANGFYSFTCTRISSNSRHSFASLLPRLINHPFPMEEGNKQWRSWKRIGVGMEILESRAMPWAEHQKWRTHEGRWVIHCSVSGSEHCRPLFVEWEGDTDWRFDGLRATP
jgi:hypothetical protein